VDAFALILKAVNAALEAHHVLQQIFDEAMTADSRVIAWISNWRELQLLNNG
jgi:hypothetical protein